MLEAEAASRSELLARDQSESTKMVIWIWMQVLVEESLERAASNHLYHLHREEAEEEEQQEPQEEEIPEQPNMPSSEVYEVTKPTSGKAASRQLAQLSRSMV
jgi:hypothetical protein